ncbi:MULTISPECIES: hypothetical protein [unclassified Pseudoalteromonas]|uniref:hypothetical protein n=1 Tax=unclassified Pseudoalteromonas TaxID=194690 RepID=UPI002097823F|nr:hypothetical protein [Pseudoalteromonas sp. XMcav2-N]MCO7189629.1 hypothetical protein [Pseudoalteromonas sp. XMcav2-N]
MLTILKANKKRALITIWTSVALGWIVMLSVLFISDVQAVRLAAVTSVALATEAAIWLSALLMGLALAQGRKAIVRNVLRLIKKR